MFHFHKWTQWGEIKERKVTFIDTILSGRTVERYQEKTCIKCGKVKERVINKSWAE